MLFLCICIVILLFMNGCTVNCRNNIDCFNSALKSCKSAKIEFNEGYERITSYKIIGKSGNYCIIESKVVNNARERETITKECLINIKKEFNDFHDIKLTNCSKENVEKNY